MRTEKREGVASSLSVSLDLDILSASFMAIPGSGERSPLVGSDEHGHFTFSEDGGHPDRPRHPRSRRPRGEGTLPASIAYSSHTSLLNTSMGPREPVAGSVVPLILPMPCMVSIYAV